MAQLEHQRTRILNLELMLEYGGESWKQYNEILHHMLNRLQAQLGEVKKQIQEVNWARKNQQTMVGDKLKMLESNWVGLVRNENRCPNLLVSIFFILLIKGQGHEIRIGLNVILLNRP